MYSMDWQRALSVSSWFHDQVTWEAALASSSLASALLTALVDSYNFQAGSHFQCQLDSLQSERKEFQAVCDWGPTSDAWNYLEEFQKYKSRLIQSWTSFFWVRLNSSCSNSWPKWLVLFQNFHGIAWRPPLQLQRLFNGMKRTTCNSRDGLKVGVEHWFTLCEGTIMSISFSNDQCIRNTKAAYFLYRKGCIDFPRARNCSIFLVNPALLSS